MWTVCWRRKRKNRDIWDKKNNFTKQKNNAKKAKQADDMNDLTDDENKLFLGSKQTNHSIQWRYKGLYSKLKYAGIKSEAVWLFGIW